MYLKYSYILLQPGSEEQCEKLRIIISNLEEQQAGYVNLLNLITVNFKAFDFLLKKCLSEFGTYYLYRKIFIHQKRYCKFSF